MIKPAFRISALCVAIGAIGATVPAYAALEEVIVTARKTEETTQTVPISITNFSAEQLQEQSISELSEFTQSTPSMQIVQSFGGSNVAVIGIRGQVQTDVQLTFDNSVGLYFDDVYLGRAAGALVQMLDVERVEILKGPQGTLYGRNTTGGALKVISRKADPGAGFEGFLQGGAGNYNSQQVSGAINIPLIEDTLAIRLSGQKAKADGYTTSIGVARSPVPTPTAYTLDPTPGEGGVVDSNNTDAHSYRANILWDISDVTSLLIQGDRSQTAENGMLTHNVTIGDLGIAAGPQLPPFHAIESDSDFYKGYVDSIPFSTAEVRGYSATLDHEFSDDHAMKLVYGKRYTDSQYNQDSDGTVGSSNGSISTQDVEQDTVELQFVGSILNDALDYTAGAFWFQESGTDETLARGAIRYFADATNTSHSVFGNGTYHWTDKLSTTMGLRYTKDTKEIIGKNKALSPFLLPALDYTGNPRTTDCLYAISGIQDGIVNSGSIDCELHDKANFYNLSWTIGVDYQIDDNMMVYAKSSTGYRSGGFSARGANLITMAPFDAEDILDFEVGTKGEYFDRNLRVNADYYHTKYDNKQETVSSQVGFFPATGIVNTGSASIDGVEVELTGSITDQFTVIATSSLLIIDFDGETRPETRISNAPEWQYSLSGIYKLPVAYGEWTLRADYAWRDEIYAGSSVETTDTFDAVGLLNARVALDLEKYGIEIAAWGKNLTGEEYYAGGFYRQGAAGAAAPSNTLAGFVGAPRTYGVEVTKNF